MKTYTLIANVAFLITFLLIMILSIVNYSKVANSNFLYLHRVGKNWNDGPLTTLNQQGLQCGHNEYNYINAKWPGTDSGCYCSYALFDPLTRGTCSRNDHRRGSFSYCQSIFPIPAMEYHTWKGKSLCGERVPASYLDLTIRAIPDSCPDTTRSCGVIDSLKNVVCIPKKTPCPLNEIKVIPTGTEIPTDKKYTVLDIANAKVLVSNENTEGEILNEFTISAGVPCADPDYDNTMGFVYELDKNYNEQECNDSLGSNKYDTRYNPIDTTTRYSLFSENNIIAAVTTLPEYPMAGLRNTKMNLYSRNYIGLNPKCTSELIADNYKKTMFLKKLYEIDVYFSTITGVSAAMMVISIITFGLITFVATLTICSSEKGTDNPCLFFSGIYTALFVISILVLCSVNLSHLGDYTEEDKILMRKDCVDEITLDAATTFNNNVDTAHSISAVLVFLSTLGILECAGLILLAIMD